MGDAFPAIRFHEDQIRRWWLLRNFAFESYQPNRFAREQILRNISAIRQYRAYLSGQLSTYPYEWGIEVCPRDPFITMTMMTEIEVTEERSGQ